MTAALASVRPSTPGVPQRSCNGCTRQLGDIQPSDWTVNGGTPAWPGSLLTDVRDQCPTCKEKP